MGDDTDQNLETQNDPETTDMEFGAKQKVPYPKHVFFILVNEFCERFSYYGMRAILIIYLTEQLAFSDDFATVIYHTFIMFTYFTPLFGAMIADSLLGKFRTILYLSIVYAVGQITLSLAATTPLKIPDVPFSMIGMALIAMGTGGIKPCVSAFGGDQFKMPEQEDQLSSFFSIFYFSINCGSLISTFLTPIFREDIKCFDNDSCYPLAFGVPAGLMIISLVIFLIGRPWYSIRKPTGNVVWNVLQTIGHALSQKRKSKEKKEHWLYYAEEKYSKREIEDIKIVLGVLFLYVPLPVFWTLYDQQGSRWTLQATRMKGDLGSFIIKPDQMQLLSSLLILLFIPLFDRIIYPLLGKCGLLKKPLQRLTVGGIFAGISFIVSGLVELELQKTYPEKIGETQSHLHFVNMAQVPLNGTLIASAGGLDPIDPGGWPIEIPPDQNYHILDLIPQGNYTLKWHDPASIDQFEFTMIGGNASTILLTNVSTFTFTLPQSVLPEKPSDRDWIESVTDTLEKSRDGKPYLKIIQFGLWQDPGFPYNDAVVQANKNVSVVLSGKESEVFEFIADPLEYSDWRSTPTKDVPIDEYQIVVTTMTETAGTEEQVLGTIDLRLGGSYILSIIKETDGKYRHRINILTDPNSMHMLWLVPQYIVLSAGEIMFSITIMDFSYQEAPKTMKSVMQSAWLMTVAFGNLIVVIIAEAKFFEEQWKEFFLFAGLMFLDMIIFSYMAYRYKPAQLGDLPSDDPAIDERSMDKRDGVDNETFSSDEKKD